MSIDSNKIKAVFLDAVEHCQPGQWDAFLNDHCDGDDNLRRRVEVLLQAHVGKDSMFDGQSSAVPPTIGQPPREQPGTLIGPYKLLEQIGEGGMGLVYMAEQQQPVRRLVALKLVKPGMDTKQVIARFEAERQALAMMDHPNIAKVHDAGTTETGRPYFVMELVRGIPLNEFCDQKRLTVCERLQLFIQVCQAVQHAHQKGIIHRDLKPTNVLITMDDTVPFPKVIDFGIAKALGQSLTDSTLHTGYSQLVGTPLYMSPEQAEMNLFGVDTRSDVYSLGVLLYELLTGTTPFDKETLTKASFDEMRRMIREDDPPRPSARMSTLNAQALSTISQQRNIDPRRISATLRGELDWIVMKALEKNRNRRYESASALAADIQRYLSDEPVLACPPTTMYRFQKFARKHKPALATAAAMALCLILGTTVSAWQAARATTAEAQAVANAQQANTQRDEAQRQRDEIRALYDKLADKDRQLQQTLYSAHVNLAQRAWDAGNIHRVNELLEQHQPKPGEADLRGFEWHYLYKLCHPEARLFHADSVAFSPDGKRLALATKESLKILDAQTYRELLSLKGRVWFAAFSPDGKRLATAVRDEEDKVKEWDAETGRELHVFKGHNKGVWELAYSPDGKRLASVGYGKTVIVRDVDSGREIFSLTQYTEHVAFSPDGNRLATCSGPLRVWDAHTGQQLLEVPTEPGVGFGVAFSPDGKRLAGSGRQGQLKVWDAQSGVELLAWKGHAQFVHSVSYSPDGKRLASASHDKLVKVWNAETGEELHSFKGHSQSVQGIAFHPSGARLASMSKDGSVRIWDAAAKAETPPTMGTDSNLRSVGFSPDGKRVVAHTSEKTSRESSVKVWDPSSGSELLTLKAPAGSRTLRVAKMSPDNKRLAAGIVTWNAAANNYDACEVKIWDAQNGEELLVLKGHSWPVVDLAFSPDSHRLVTCGSQPNGFGNDQGKPCEVKVWDVASGKELLAITGHKSLVNCVAYSPEGKRIATLSRDDTLKVWDAQSAQELLSMPAKVTNGGSLAFSPDGKRIASADNPRFTSFSQAGEVKVWDAETGKEVFTLQGHTAYITGIAFSPDGKRLASSAGEVPGAGLQGREVKLWDAQTGEELLTLEAVGDGGVDFSPDGHRLVTAGREGLKIFDATPLPEKP